MHASLLENSAVQEAVCGLPTKSMNKMNVVVMPISGPYKRPCDGERKPRYFNILEEIIISCDTRYLNWWSGDRSYLGIKQLPAPTEFKPMAVESFPAASPDTKTKRPG